jgi:ribokinase
MEKRITVIGSSNVDMIMKLERLPAVGETVTEGEFLQTYGGKGANQAVAAARAGGRVAFVTGLGDDPFGQNVLKNFRQDGLETDRIVIASGVPTGTALVMFDRRGDNYLAVAPGANYALEPAHMDACADLIAQSAMLVMQMEIPVPTIVRALELASGRGVPVLFNFAPMKTRELPVSGQMTGLVVNEVEAAALTGLSVGDAKQAKTAAQALLAQGPEFVILTLGAEGAHVASRALRQQIPAFPVTPVDTTAAGDVFCGALAVALVEGTPLLDAVRFASAASALSVTRVGAQPSIPRRDEIDAFLNASEPA